MLGLWHVALNVRDLAAMEKFYVEIMGMHVEWRPDIDNVYLSSGRDNLALHRSEDLAQAAPSALDHIGFAVMLKEDVDEWYEHMRGHAVEIENAPRTHRDGARSFYLHDPEKNRVQIICHPPIVAAMNKI